jgi:hypothetical protein
MRADSTISSITITLIKCPWPEFSGFPNSHTAISDHPVHFRNQRDEHHVNYLNIQERSIF